MKRSGCRARELSVHGPCRPYEVPAQPWGPGADPPLRGGPRWWKGPSSQFTGWTTLGGSDLGRAAVSIDHTPQRAASPKAPGSHGMFFTLFLYLLEKAMAPYSTTLAWRIPRTEEPGRLQSTGSQSRTQLSDSAFFLPLPYF